MEGAAHLKGRPASYQAGFCHGALTRCKAGRYLRNMLPARRHPTYTALAGIHSTQEEHPIDHPNPTQGQRRNFR